jgi:phage recombination protein Bet
MSTENQIAVRPTLIGEMAAQYNVEPAKFLATLKATVMPKRSSGESQVSDEDLAAFCMVAHEYGLNPFLREIHAYPNKAGGITAVVGIDGWAKLVNRRTDLDGIEFTAHDEDGKPHSVTCTIYIKSRSKPVSVTEYYSECQRGTEPWRTMPRRMLRHKALIQAARYAFGFSGIHDEDEGVDIAEAKPRTVRNVTPAPAEIAFVKPEELVNGADQTRPEVLMPTLQEQVRDAVKDRGVKWSELEPILVGRGYIKQGDKLSALSDEHAKVVLELIPQMGGAK